MNITPHIRRVGLLLSAVYSIILPIRKKRIEKKNVTNITIPNVPNARYDTPKMSAVGDIITLSRKKKPSKMSLSIRANNS